MPQGRPTLTEDHFRLLVENSSDILSIRNADGRVRYMSPAVHRILGYEQEELVGSMGLELLHPDERTAVQSAYKEFWKTPGASDAVQYRARHANGSWVSLEVVACNLLDHPALRGVVFNCRDISQRKNEEAGKDQLIVELKQALSGVLPICASCKKIQNESGNWQQVEIYIRERAPVEFSHGMCPECARLWFPDHAGQLPEES